MLVLGSVASGGLGWFLAGGCGLLMSGMVREHLGFWWLWWILDAVVRSRVLVYDDDIDDLIDGRKKDGWMTDDTEDGRNKGCSISQLCPRDCACLGVFEDLFPPRSDAGLFDITCCLFGWLQGCYKPTTPMCCVNSNMLGAPGISNSGFIVRISTSWAAY